MLDLVGIVAVSRDGELPPIYEIAFQSRTQVLIAARFVKAKHRYTVLVVNVDNRLVSWTLDIIIIAELKLASDADLGAFALGTPYVDLAVQRGRLDDAVDDGQTKTGTGAVWVFLREWMEELLLQESARDTATRVRHRELDHDVRAGTLHFAK